MDWSVVILWIGINALIGYAIGQKKNEVGPCVLVSIFLGPIGWLIAMCMGDDFRKCPFCAENLKHEAIVCPHCQRDLPKIEKPKIEPAPPPKPALVPPPQTPEQIKRGKNQLVITGAVVAAVIIIAIFFAAFHDSGKRVDAVAASESAPSSAPADYLAPLPPPEFVRLTTDFTLVNFKGREVKTLEPGKRLRVVARYEHDVTVDYLGEHYSVPTAVTEPAK
jgi:hypothetical protein